MILATQTCLFAITDMPNDEAPVGKVYLILINISIFYIQYSKQNTVFEKCRKETNWKLVLKIGLSSIKGSINLGAKIGL